jgi:hypothetical protein
MLYSLASSVKLKLRLKIKTLPNRYRRYLVINIYYFMYFFKNIFPHRDNSGSQCFTCRYMLPY